MRRSFRPVCWALCENPDYRRCPACKQTPAGVNAHTVCSRRAGHHGRHATLHGLHVGRLLGGRVS